MATFGSQLGLQGDTLPRSFSPSSLAHGIFLAPLERRQIRWAVIQLSRPRAGFRSISASEGAEKLDPFFYGEEAEEDK
jgi:hypothetical protein